MDIRELIGSLHQLDWGKDVSLFKAAILLEKLWETGKTHKALADYLDTLQYPDPAVTRTAELHSWKLSRNPTWDLTLNQFLPFMEDRKASENIHNHTRPLVSLTIYGGYEQNYYHLKKHLCEYKDGDVWEGQIEAYPGPSTEPGTVYITDTNVFHALTTFEPGTMTLVVYGPLKQECIVCFNQISGRVERRRTATNAKNTLVEKLRSL